MTLSQRFGGWILGLFGWRVVPRATIPDKCVVVAYPHTSNWDFPLMYFGSMVYGKKLNWLGKAELFRSFMGPIMRRLGGISVKRDSPQGLVQQIADAFANVPTLRLVIPPEGTRKKTDYWKSGFYRIALAAKVPVHLGRVCIATKTVDFGDPLPLTGDVHIDMDRIRAWYEGAVGVNPASMGTIRLRDEDVAAEAGTKAL